MDIHSYLAQEGVKPFVDPKRFWSWAGGRMGAQPARQFMEMMSQRTKDIRVGDPNLYNFLATPKAAVVAASFEYNLLVEILKWVEPRLPKQGTIVEFGCHTGLLTRFYARERPQCQVIGLDLSQQAIQTAQNQAQAKGINNLTFYATDLCQPDKLPDINADCIVSGRVLSELMTPLRRRQETWRNFIFPERSKDLDQDARSVLDSCVRIVQPGGKFLVTERLADFDRLNRLWLLVQEASFNTTLDLISPIEWKDVAGEHQTWFFEAVIGTGKEIQLSPTALNPSEIPFLSREAELVHDETRVMLNGLLALEIWQALHIVERVEEGLLRWPRGDEVHYELGITGKNLGYAYVASNTGLNLLTLFLPFEMEMVKRDLQEYLTQLRSEGAEVVEK
jgi:SAM-dependent methyltransferase